MLLNDPQEPQCYSDYDGIDPIGQILTYGCHDCDLPDATGAWPDSWVGVEEAADHKRKHPTHRVHFIVRKEA